MAAFKKLALTLGVLIAGCASTVPEYFPNGTFSDGVNEWYSGQLHALYQSPLPPRTTNPRNRIYRFTWLRTFNRPVSLKLTILENGNGDLEVTRANGAGGYDPGILDYRSTKEIDRESVSSFLSLVEKAGFWDLPIDPRRVVLPDGSVTGVFGTDGSQWILEGVEGGKFHVVDYWSPEDGPYREALLFLLGLTEIEHGPIY